MLLNYQYYVIHSQNLFKEKRYRGSVGKKVPSFQFQSMTTLRIHSVYDILFNPLVRIAVVNDRTQNSTTYHS